MFDGVPADQQFHQFISSRIPSNQTVPPAISTSTNLNFLSFDPILFPPPLPTHHQTLFQTNRFLQTPTACADIEFMNGSSEGQGKVNQEIDINDDSWSNDEVIQLLRIKSTSDNWFRDFTWDHVSRKLAEIGYKRSAEKCKDKFEEETCRSFSNTIGYNKNINSRYLISEELDEHLYNINHHHDLESPEVNVNHQEQLQRLHDEIKGEEDKNVEAQGQIKGHFPSGEIILVQAAATQEDVQLLRKRKRKHKKFKMVKGLCVDLVQKMMSQQEEMHRKLLEDMMNRDEEKIKREETWRKEEMERIEREIHMRKNEQEMAKERQSTITDFLNKITSFEQKIQIPFDMINLQDFQTNKIAISSSSEIITKIASSDKMTENPDHNIPKDDEIGKRWPRDEVLALINIRSNINIDDHHQDNNNKGGGGGGSLWERISQGMLASGYKRSAKRCKEKWENINKYFRKTKDTKKKRSLDSRTCPYYHQLNKLYNQDKTSSSSNSAAGLSSHHQPEHSLTPKLTPEN